MSVKTALQSLTHLFFPHLCAGCGSDLLHRGQLLCLHCQEKIPLTGFHHYAGNPVEDIFRGRLPIVAATSYAWFTKGSVLQNLLHRLKYGNRPDIGLYFGRHMGASLQEGTRFQNIDGMVPLPLFAARERKRGYNQAALLCEGISAATGIPVRNNAIVRTMATDTQTHKNRMERWLNMEGRFEVTDKTLVCGRHILLVDDVVTTGATLEACGQVLIGAGCSLSIATLACAAS